MHMAISREHAKKQTKDFADFWNNAPIPTKLCYFRYGAKASELPEKYDEVEHFGQYLNCFRCGESYKNFRESKSSDCPNGVTIQPILDYQDFNHQEGISL